MSGSFTTIDDIISDENFIGWYTGEPRQSATWNAWLSQHPEAGPLVKAAIAYLDGISFQEKPVGEQHLERASARLERALQQGKLVSLPARRRRKWWLPAAAAAVLLFAAGAYFLLPGGKKTVLETHYGRLGQYHLPDGSEVQLNANSEVALDKSWEPGKDREVWLKGEAFFKVQKKPNADRFIVHTGSMDIIVTGTQFNAVSRDGEASVLLKEGSVTVVTKDREIKMKPGEFVKIENDVPGKQEVSEEKVLAWRQSKLIFDHTSMAEVAQVIERHYGVKVSFADSAIASKEIGGIMSNDNLDLLIESLEALGQFSIQKTDTGIVISSPL